MAKHPSALLDQVRIVEILFGADVMEETPVTTGNCNGNSPLVWDGTMTKSLRAYARANQAAVIVPFILGGGMHFVDIRDVADAMVRAMVHGSPRPVYHFRGEATTLDGFFRQVAKEAGYEPSWVTLPKAVSWNLARLNLALGSKLSVLPDPVVVEMGSHFWDVKSMYAEEDLGFRNRAPSETLRDTIAWLREHHPVHARLARVAGRHWVEIALAQGVGDHVADRGFVVDDEDALLHGMGACAPHERLSCHYTTVL